MVGHPPDVDSLIEEIKKACPDGRGLVSLDGFVGCGKTPLARQLAERLKAVHIEVDDFLERNQGGYLEFLRRDELTKRIEQAITSCAIVIVEGVLIRKVLERADFQPALCVYVKRVGAGGWYDDSVLQHSSAQEAIKLEENSLRQFAKLMGSEASTVPNIWRELIEYHYAHRPHERAHLVFVNKETR